MGSWVFAMTFEIYPPVIKHWLAGKCPFASHGGLQLGKSWSCWEIFQRCLISGGIPAFEGDI